ncbi:MAG: signal peptide peptidase SppA [Spirochaetota bacterium]
MAAQQESDKRPVLSSIVRIVATGIFVVSLLLNLVFILVIALMGAAGGARGVSPGYRKVYSERNTAVPQGKEDQVALVPLTGVIMEGTGGGGFPGGVEDPVSAVVDRLNIIRKDGQVKGVLLLMDSPGGGVTASDALAREVRLFREETGMPVVTLVNQLGASGGYYVAAATDAIVARPTALTGSIGVIVTTFNLSALLDRLDVRYLPIKSAPHKDALSPFKPVQEEEVAWMQEIVDGMLDRFIDTVVQGRPGLSRAQVEELADGMVYLSPRAEELGLIDQVGYFHEALALLSEKAGVRSPVLVEYLRQRTLGSVLGAMAASVSRITPLVTAPLTEELRRWSGPQPCYLWEAAVTAAY